MQLRKGLLLVVMTAVFGLASGDALAAEAGDSGLGGDFSSAWFISPLPNAYFEGAPVTIDAEVGVYQGLADGPIAAVEVFVNGESIGAQECAAGCIFSDIELAKGIHDFELVTDIGSSTAVKVYVDEEVPVPPVEMGETGGDDVVDGGGNCSVNDEPTSPGLLLALPMLLLLPGFRRQR